jgi:hypothetical protein
LINHVELKHPAESPAKSPVKQSSLKSFVDSPKNINSNLKEQIPTAIEEMVAKVRRVFEYENCTRVLGFRASTRLLGAIPNKNIKSGQA